MKRSVQILLLFACLAPLWVGAEGETMEERKRRITRKYLRARMNVSYSDMVVPASADASVTSVEDEEVLASEKFQQAQVDLQRQEPGVAMPPPPARQPVPRKENSNWLLSENSELNDPYTDPFSQKKTEDEPSKPDDWSIWGKERNPSSYADSQRESRFKWRSYNPADEQQSEGYGSTRQGLFSPGDPRAYSSDGISSGFQQQGGLMPNSGGGLDLSRDKIFNADLNRSRLQSPFPRKTESSPDRSFGSGSQQRREGYTPYKNPYQTQNDQRKEHRGGYGVPKQEYLKPNTFQQWKEKNPTRFDPMGDDAFIDEMMPKTRR